MTAREKRAIEALMNVARPIILSGWRRDSCIASTRIGILALAEFGVRAHPIGATVAVYNHAWRVLVAELGHPPESPEEWEGTEAWSLALGMDWESDDVMGHVVIAVGARTVIDLSIDQASRPAKGIRLDKPMLATLPPGWKKGEERYFTHTPTYSVGIAAEPRNKRFLHSRDWTDLARFRDPVRRVVAAMRAEGAR